MGAAPASQSEDLCRTKRSLSDKGTPRSHLAMGKIRAEELLPKVLENLRYGSCGWGGSGCNITTVSRQKKFLGADWSGLGRTGADIKPEMLKTIISCIKNKIFHYQKMKRNTQNPLSCIPFTNHSWNRYGRQERLSSPLHKRSRSRMNAVVNLRNHKFMNARIL